jgi:hypothetical protein
MRLGVFNVTAEFATNETEMLPVASHLVTKCGRQPVKFPYSRLKWRLNILQPSESQGSVVFRWYRVSVALSLGQWLMIAYDDTRRSSQRLCYKRCLIFNKVFHLLHLIPYLYLCTFHILPEQNLISLGASLVSSIVRPIGLKGESDGVFTPKRACSAN